MEKKGTDFGHDDMEEESARYGKDECTFLSLYAKQHDPYDFFDRTRRSLCNFECPALC